MSLPPHQQLGDVGFVEDNQPCRVQAVAYAQGFDELIVQNRDEARVIRIRAGEVQAFAVILRVAAYALLTAETLVEWLGWQFDELVKQEVA